jgi:hypothetical protein
MICFFDIEASSLEQGSFPIEIGWVPETGVGESHLIRPEPAWTGWSMESQKLHGITREMLVADGKPAAWVARRVLEVLPPDTVVGISDSPAFDQFWLSMLLDVVKSSSHPVLFDLTHLLRQDVQPLLRHLQARRMDADEMRATVVGMVLQVQEDEEARKRVRHRALTDAEGLHWRWREVQRRVAHAVSEPSGDR